MQICIYQFNFFHGETLSLTALWHALTHTTTAECIVELYSLYKHAGFFKNTREVLELYHNSALV